MRYLFMVVFCLTMISCVNKKTDVENIDTKKTEVVKSNKKIKELENQVFHSVLYQNEYFYFLGKKGDFEDVTLNFNVKRLINDATIDNIFYYDEASPYQNQLYRITDHTKKDNLNYEIVVFDEWEDKDAKINFSLVNKKDNVWKFQYIPSSPWKQENSKRTYSQNLDLREEYLFINQKNLDSIVVLTKGLYSDEEDGEGNAYPVSYENAYYFKLKEKYKDWKNYNPIRFISSKANVNIYESPDTTSKVISSLKYNDWIIINDTLNKQQKGSENWLDIDDRVNFIKGFILNKGLAEKPVYNLPFRKKR